METKLPSLDAVDTAVPVSSDSKEPWGKPEISSFAPVTSAQGISYTPLDGISNLTP